MLKTDLYSRSKPRPGNRVAHDGGATGTAIRVEGNLCWAKYDTSGDILPFIWRFRDGLNALTTWDSKHPNDKLTFCPGVTP